MARIKQQFKEHTEHYASFGDGEGIYPISKVDAEILSVFLDIIVKLGADKNLTKIIDAYKVLPDQDFLALIESYNESFEGNLKDRQVMVNIKDQFIGNVSAIFSFTRGSFYDNKSKRSVPILIVNKSDNNKVPYANTQIIFQSDEELEQEFNKLKTKLSECTNLYFI